MKNSQDIVDRCPMHLTWSTSFQNMRNHPTESHFDHIPFSANETKQMPAAIFDFLRLLGDCICQSLEPLVITSAFSYMRLAQ